MRRQTRGADQSWVVHETDCPIESRPAGLLSGVTWRTLISGDRSPTSGLTVGIAEIEPGKSGPIRPHSHPQAEAYYVLARQGRVLIGEEFHPLRAGSAALIPGDAAHTAVNTGSEVLRLLYVFPTDAFEDVEYSDRSTDSPR